jgi:hypothetical protein
VDIGRPGKAQLLQRGGGQAGLVALVAQQDDVIGEPRRLAMTMLAGSRRHSRTFLPITSGPAIVPSGRRVIQSGGRVDQRRARSHRLQGLIRS